MTTDIEEARARVAIRNMPANGRAILRGEWDKGSLVKEELAKVRRERGHTDDM